jgi:hypothetical protein
LKGSLSNIVNAASYIQNVAPGNSIIARWSYTADFFHGIDPERTLSAPEGVPHQRGKDDRCIFLCGWFKQLFVSKSQVLALKCALPQPRLRSTIIFTVRNGPRVAERLGDAAVLLPSGREAWRLRWVRVTEALARYRQGRIEDAEMAMRQARLFLAVWLSE